MRIYSDIFRIFVNWYESCLKIVSNTEFAWWAAKEDSSILRTFRIWPEIRWIYRSSYSSCIKGFSSPSFASSSRAIYYALSRSYLYISCSSLTYSCSSRRSTSSSRIKLWRKTFTEACSKILCLKFLQSLIFSLGRFLSKIERSSRYLEFYDSGLTKLLIKYVASLGSNSVSVMFETVLKVSNSSYFLNLISGLSEESVYFSVYFLIVFCVKID